MLVSPVFHGDPDAVTAAILADPGIAAADELVLFLPPAFGLEENVRLLTDMAATVGPALGWAPTEYSRRTGERAPEVAAPVSQMRVRADSCRPKSALGSLGEGLRSAAR
jgi:hypothetical protein